MFKFLKEKLKNTISKISRKVEKEGGEEAVKAEPKPEKPKVEEKKPSEAKVEKPKEEEKVKVGKTEKKKEEAKEPEKKGFLGKIREKVVTKKINEAQFEELF